MISLYIHGTAKYSVLKYKTGLAQMCICIYVLLWHVNAFALWINCMLILSSFNILKTHIKVKHLSKSSKHPVCALTIYSYDITFIFVTNFKCIPLNSVLSLENGQPKDLKGGVVYTILF